MRSLDRVCGCNVLKLAALLAFSSLAALGQGPSIGVFRSSANALWALDTNGDHTWESTDLATYFGLSGDIPITGDWNGSGQRHIGVFRNGVWYVDTVGSAEPDHGDRLGVAQKNAQVPLIVGILINEHIFHAAPIVSEDLTGRDHSITVPVGTPLKVWLFSRTLRITDSSAKPIEIPGHAIPFQVAAGVSRLDYVFNITGVQ